MPVYISDNSFPKVIQAPQTSFPSTPDTGATVMRSDLDHRTFFYDGTRWLSTQLYTHGFEYPSISASAYNGIGVDTTFDLYITDCIGWTYHNGVVDGSNYWTLRYSLYYANNSATTIADHVTSSDAAGSFIEHSTRNHDTVYTTDGSPKLHGIRTLMLKTGSPPNAFAFVKVCYREIAT